MKYIKTKYKIYEMYEVIGEGDANWLVVKDNFFGAFTVPKVTVTKQADTIEKLCDEFVFEYYGGAMRRCYYSPNSKTWVDCDSGCDLHRDFVETIKGGIWTDKGFIYVAKMNEKGELELL